MTTEKSIYTKKSDAGKGDVPRNISKAFRDNYDLIDWHRNSERKEYNFIHPASSKDISLEIDKRDNGIIVIKKFKK